MKKKKAVSQSGCTPCKLRRVARIPMKPLQNYKFISTLLPVVRLIDSEGIDFSLRERRVELNEYRSSFGLYLSEDLQKKIKDSARLPGSDPYALQVLVRIGLDDGSWMQRETFPECILRVNGHFILIGEKSRTFNAKTYTQPINITKNCLKGQRSAVQWHSRYVYPIPTAILSIEWQQTPGQTADFYITVIVAEKLTIPEVVEQVKKEGVRQPYFTGKMAQEEIESYSKNGLSCTSIKTSFICPLGKTRIVTPCRGAFCSHLQCVDALTLLNMNEGRPEWKRICFLCNQSLGDIHADGLFLELLQSVPSDVEEVIFNSDGTWICETEDRAIQISGSFMYQLDPAGIKPHIDKTLMKNTANSVEQAASSHMLADVKELGVEVESSLVDGRESEDEGETIAEKSIKSSDEDSTDSKGTSNELVESSDDSIEKDSCIILDADAPHEVDDDIDVLILSHRQGKSAIKNKSEIKVQIKKTPETDVGKDKRKKDFREQQYVHRKNVESEIARLLKLAKRTKHKDARRKKQW